MHNRWKSGLAAIVAILMALGLAAALSGRAQAATSPPATTLGIYTSSGAIPDKQQPNVENTYLDWGTSFPSSFASGAEAAGATPFVELEPWIGSPGGDTCTGSGPTMTAIGANGSSIKSYADALGSAVKAGGKPVIFTFAHEFNIGGQYPWSVGDCEGTTPSQWIAAWDAVRADVNSTAGGLASWMWAPNIDQNGGNTLAAQYWPGASEVDMVGVDGYPSFCGCDTFAATFGSTFSEIRALPGFSSLPRTKIFVSETDLAPLGSDGYESVPDFIADMCSSSGDGDGFLEFEDGTPAMTDAQWSQADTALASDCSGGGGGGITEAPTTAPGAPVVTGGTTVTIKWTIPSADDQADDQWSYTQLLVLLDDGTVEHNVHISTDPVTMYLSPANNLVYKERECNADGCSAYSGSTHYHN